MYLYAEAFSYFGYVFVFFAIMKIHLHKKYISIYRMHFSLLKACVYQGASTKIKIAEMFSHAFKEKLLTLNEFPDQAIYLTIKEKV